MNIDDRHDGRPATAPGAGPGAGTSRLDPPPASSPPVWSVAPLPAVAGSAVAPGGPPAGRRPLRWSLTRFRGAALVAAGGLGFATVGAVLGGVGSGAAISPAAVHSFLAGTTPGAAAGLPTLPGGVPGIPSLPSGLPGLPSGGGNFSLAGMFSGSGGSVSAGGSAAGTSASGSGSVSVGSPSLGAPPSTTLPGVPSGGISGGAPGGGSAPPSLTTVTGQLPSPGSTPSLTTVTKALGSLPSGGLPSLSTLSKLTGALPAPGSGTTCVTTPGVPGASSSPVTGSGALSVTSSAGSLGVDAGTGGVRICG
ncbi:MAG: hypothetical protein ACRDY3_12490 [Acidimicrobiales bacterium]